MTKTQMSLISLKEYLGMKNPPYALLFEENGDVSILTPKGKTFTLKELQTAIGGCIELYPNRFKDRLVVCDEEGLIKNRPINPIFTHISGISLVGNVLLCPEEMFE